MSTNSFASSYQDFLELVGAAVLAPSPDNNQPWRFARGDDHLIIHSDPDRGLPSDVGSMYCWMALGSAAENVCIAARQRGWEATVEPLPDVASAQPAEPSAIVRFQLGAAPDPLFPHLTRRCTSRRLFSRRDIASDTFQRLQSSLARFSEVGVKWLSQRRALRQMAWLVAGSDRVRFEYRPFHEEMFKQLRLTPAEAEETRDGLDARTLELPPGTTRLLQWLRPWERMQWVHWSGLGRLFTLPSVLAVVRCAAVGILHITQRTPEQYLTSGRAFQRLWLAATAEQLSLHPLGSLPIFLAHLESEGPCQLRPDHQIRLRRLQERYLSLVPDIGEKRPVMLFRIGHGRPPAYRSLRRPVQSMLAAAEPPLDNRG